MIDSLSVSSLLSVAPTVSESLVNSTGKESLSQIHELAKTMEGSFVGQLMSEMTKSLSMDGLSEDTEVYHDFIQQTMTRAVTQGEGFGLAPTIERYLKQKMHIATDPPHLHQTVVPVKTD